MKESLSRPVIVTTGWACTGSANQASRSEDFVLGGLVTSEGPYGSPQLGAWGTEVALESCWFGVGVWVDADREALRLLDELADEVLPRNWEVEAQPLPLN